MNVRMGRGKGLFVGQLCWGDQSKIFRLKFPSRLGVASSEIATPCIQSSQMNSYLLTDLNFIVCRGNRRVELSKRQKYSSLAMYLKVE